MHEIALESMPQDGEDAAGIINRVLADMQPGDTVLLPEGTFSLQEAVKVPQGLILKGAGREKTRLRFGGNQPHHLIQMRDVTDVEIADLALDGTCDPKARQGLIATRCQRLFLHHLTIENFVDTGTFGPHGMLISETTHSVVCDNVIRNIAPDDPWGAGMRFSTGSISNRIERNQIDNTGRGGIFTNNGSSDAVIRENVVTRSGGIGFAIEVHSGSVRTLVEDNVVDHGLSIVSSWCAIRRNLVTASDNTWKGYGIEGGGGPFGIVTDNIIHYGQIQGISMSGFDHHMWWAYNQFICCSMWGMQIQGPSQSNQIHNLYFYKNIFSRVMKGHPSTTYKGADGHAIRINNHARNLVFDANQISANEGQAFQILGKDVDACTFINNVIVNNRSHVIRAYPGASVIWENNLVSGNANTHVPASAGDMGESPHAAFKAPCHVRTGVPVSFENRSHDAQGIKQLLWDFGDGLPCTNLNSVHVYHQPGLYRVNLLVWNVRNRAARAAERFIQVRD